MAFLLCPEDRGQPYLSLPVQQGKSSPSSQDTVPRGSGAVRREAGNTGLPCGGRGGGQPGAGWVLSLDARQGTALVTHPETPTAFLRILNPSNILNPLPMGSPAGCSSSGWSLFPNGITPVFLPKSLRAPLSVAMTAANSWLLTVCSGLGSGCCANGFAHHISIYRC